MMTTQQTTGKKFIIVDFANLYFRCAAVAKGDPYTRAGLALNISMQSLLKVWNKFKADHVVVALEGKSWRRSIYPMYKKHRDVAKAMRTTSEIEADDVLLFVANEFIEFLRTKTNVTVLQSSIAEGDDIIARWTQLHPNDEHIILSSDTDFAQLVSENVTIFDGMKEIHIQADKVTDNDGDELVFNVAPSGKLKVGGLVRVNPDFVVEKDWQQYALFVKCIRGDAGDGVFSAYPKVRINKIQAAWNDRELMGYDWNNLMLQEWKVNKEDEDSKLVKTEYEMNKTLIDLTKQPEYVLEDIDSVIKQETNKAPQGGIGLHLMKFCKAQGLINIGKEAQKHATYLNARYK